MHDPAVRHPHDNLRSQHDRQAMCQHITVRLKVHKIENFFDSDFGICVISLLVMHK